jgi:hypothetical protein
LDNILGVEEMAGRFSAKITAKRTKEERRKRET